MSGGGSVEERLARALSEVLDNGFIAPNPNLAREAVAKAGLALYDPVTHVAVSRETAQAWLRTPSAGPAALVLAKALERGE